MNRMTDMVRNLPLEDRRRILAANGGGEDLARQLGIIPAPTSVAAPAAPAAPKGRVRGSGTRVTLSGITFDSRGEAEAYTALRDLFPAVFCHPKVALCEDDELDRGRHMAPDFIVALEVYKDGTFLAACIDSKGMRNGHAFAEDDWKVRKSWMFRNTGVLIRVVTKDVIAAMRWAMVEGRQIADELLGRK